MFTDYNESLLIIFLLIISTITPIDLDGNTRFGTLLGLIECGFEIKRILWYIIAFTNLRQSNVRMLWERDGRGGRSDRLQFSHT